jgi:sugar lactone lactonase YvrE
MSSDARLRPRFAGAATLLVSAVCLCFSTAFAQKSHPPNPYHEVSQWAKLPSGVSWGGVISVDPAPNGDIWVFHRSDPPLLRFDQSGTVVKSFGAGLFVQAHGMSVDADGNVWVTDAQAKDGKGQQVFKFSPEGKVLLTLGKAGVAGEGPDTFSGPADVVVARNGDIFVADGHIADSTVGRVVKFSKNGAFVKAWGKRGKGPGEFDTPHAIAMDSQGRIFVADRGNNRIQIFDQDGRFIDQWKQFGRPSGVFIDRQDTIYVADSQSNATLNPGFTRGIRIGRAKDGAVTAMVPFVEADPDKNNNAGSEGVAADAKGNLYAAEVTTQTLKKYAK